MLDEIVMIVPIRTWCPWCQKTTGHSIWPATEIFIHNFPAEDGIETRAVGRICPECYEKELKDLCPDPTLKSVASGCETTTATTEPRSRRKSRATIRRTLRRDGRISGSIEGGAR